MGGQAFVELEATHGGPIHVPRIPPATYHKLSSEIKTKLQTLFLRVVIPREPPGKLDHGDIDFLVGGILPSSSSSSTSNNNITDIWTTIRALLNAPLHLPRGGSHSFGILHPDIPNAYIQVDVELSPGDGTPSASALFAWTQFTKGDADLTQIIGICHRHLGLTCNDRGLHLRVSQIEPYDKKKSLLFLTCDPTQAMTFFGLDAEKYYAGFATEDELFEWIVRGRFFSRTVFEERIEKHNDRARLLKRPMYRRFMTEFIPTHPSVGLHSEEGSSSPPWTRDQVLEEALTTFSAHAEYQRMMTEHNTKEAEETFWKRVKDVIPAEGSSLAVGVKGLRRWVGFVDGKPYIRSSCVKETPIWTEEIRGEGREEEVLRWVGENWQTVKALEKKRSKDSREGAGNNVRV
ncbi:hypothetical protein DM02DRAFT_614008 [Periconia macrospinosa]|uniref:Uncharacterized protein n=1 Tax=Periconia macrospinosa TaxID=97972 RepID=A0A2V1DSH4_9PLEO|nr:hypothetical protein DM02DRAFT_614008 [Periconia macrospinosa]